MAHKICQDDDLRIIKLENVVVKNTFSHTVRCLENKYGVQEFDILTELVYDYIQGNIKCSNLLDYIDYKEEKKILSPRKVFPLILI